ncbi:hypothetical protein GCM10011408_15000 [Dyella caseinilytica]|nr:hypothetical protein GCM10011408_15000 [Dyella caseinilytica]
MVAANTPWVIASGARVGADRRRRRNDSPDICSFLSIIPAKAGIHGECEAWIPAFAGMTLREIESSAEI